MKALANSRRFTRTPISTPVLMRPTGAIEFEEGTSIDISGSGISVVLKQEPSEAMLKEPDAYLRFEIPGKGQPEVLVEVSADVVRRDDFPTSPNQEFKIAFHFNQEEMDQNVQQELVAFLLRQQIHQEKPSPHKTPPRSDAQALHSQPDKPKEKRGIFAFLITKRRPPIPESDEQAPHVQPEKPKEKRRRFAFSTTKRQPPIPDSHPIYRLHCLLRRSRLGMK